MADYRGAVEMLVPEDYVFPNAWGYTRKYVILHKTAGGSTAQGIAGWFQSGSGGAHVSVHYVVGLDGGIVQCVREADGAGGNGILEPGHDSWWDESINPNLLTFSIESVDSALDNSTPMPQAQKDALFPLIKDICTRWQIPMRPADANGGITGHYSIAPQSRAHCPGNFAWDDLWAYLQNGGSMGGTPQGWDDKNGALIAPNGHKVVLGFRDYILNHQWDPDDWPLEEEHNQDPLEISNPGLGAGRQQLFRMSMLGYTPAKGVFVEWMGQEVIALRQELATQKQSTPSQDQAVLSKQLADIQQGMQQIATIAKQFEAS